jgi:UDP-2,3-diacylglucosamine pyrophosphatase LpxH
MSIFSSEAPSKNKQKSLPGSETLVSGTLIADALIADALIADALFADARIADTLIEDIGNRPLVNVYSDFHINPEDLWRMENNLLIGEEPRLTGIKLLDGLLARPEDNYLTILNGDTFHSAPSMIHPDLINDAMRLLVKRLQKQENPGDHLKILPGNHDSLKYFPEDVQAKLVRMEVLVPSGILKFSSGSEQYIVMHGHQVQPESHKIPLANDPVLEELYMAFFRLYRILARDNGVNEENYPFSKWFNKKLKDPQINWMLENLSNGYNGIFGHTHVAAKEKVSKDITAKATAAKAIASKLEAGEIEKPPVWYLNSGFLDWIMRNLTYLKIQENIEPKLISMEI